MAEFSGNGRNFSQRSNILAGSDAFSALPFFLQSINIPGINYSHPEIGGRWGTKIVMNADNVDFGQLSFTILLDEAFEVYDEIMTLAKSQLDNDTGELTQKSFEFWITVTDGKGSEVIKWTFQNAKIESIGDLQYDYTSDDTNFTLDMSLKFDNFDYKILNKVSSLPSLKI